jgi:hypothetical protein
MRLRGIFVLLIFSLMAGGFFACREPKDDVWPEVTVLLPAVNSYYSPGDTILLKAEFSDDVALSFVKVALVDAYNNPVLATVSLVPDSNWYELEAEMVIDDAALKGGIYNLQFQASDGVNTASEYVRVIIDEPERKLLYPIVVTSEGTNQIRILRTDSTGVFRSMYLYQGDYAASDVSTAFGLLFFSGKVVTDLQAFGLAENKTLWSVPCEQSPDGHWFETLRYGYPWLFVSQYDGYVRGYDRYGVQQFKSQEVANNYAELVFLSGNYVLASMKGYVTTNRQLALFHVSGGKLIDLQPLDFVPVGFGDAGTNKAFVFGNDGGDGVIAIYDYVASTLAVINRVKGEKIIDVDNMTENEFYLSAGDEIYHYTYKNNSIIPFASGYQDARVACESVNDQVYVASGNALYLLNAQNGSVDTSWQFGGQVLDVHLMYNK